MKHAVYKYRVSLPALVIAENIYGFRAKENRCPLATW
jgi:hypothetical protein